MHSSLSHPNQHAVMGGEDVDPAEPDLGVASSPGSPGENVIRDHDGDGRRRSRRQQDSSTLSLGPDEDQSIDDGWRQERDRFLDRLFAWKAGEAWREALLLCGAADGGGWRGRPGSSCEIEVRDEEEHDLTVRDIAGEEGDNEKGLRKAHLAQPPGQSRQKLKKTTNIPVHPPSPEVTGGRIIGKIRTGRRQNQITPWILVAFEPSTFTDIKQRKIQTSIRNRLFFRSWTQSTRGA